MSQYVNIKPKGLFTYYNNLAEVEPGALLKASNVNLDRDGILSPRRGIKYYGPSISATATDRAQSLLQYKNTLLMHYNDKMTYDNGSGTFTAFSGSYLEVVSKERMKSLETKGNLYFTTADGVKKLSVQSASGFATASITNSGAPIAIGGSAIPNFSVSGFMSANSQVAYKTTWSTKDINNLLVEGAPSDAIIAYNYSPTGNASVDLTIFIPSEVTVDSIFRIYRIEESTIGTALNTSYNLIFEGNPTAGEITAKKIVYNDFATEVFRNAGEPLYTNSTAEGALQSNYRPPVARDLELFNNFTFYANTKTAQQTNVTMLSLSGITASSSTFAIAGTTANYAIQFRGQTEVSSVTAQATGFITDATFFLLNSANNERRYFVWMDLTGVTPAPTSAQTVGRIGVRVDLSGGPFTADQVGAKIAAAINATTYTDFVAVNTLGVVAISNIYNGYCDNTVNSTDAPTSFTFSTTQQGLGEDAALNFALLSNASTLQNRVTQTAQSIVRVMNQIQKDFIFTYTSVSDSTPGIISIQAANQSTKQFYLVTNDSAIVNNFSPALNVEVTNSTIVGDTVTTLTNHNLSAGNDVFLYAVAAGATNLSGKYKVLSITSPTVYKLTTSLAGVTSAGFTATAQDGSSDNAAVNGLSFSKENQPESVPLVNQILVGATDEPILRIKRLRESLFIFKTDGLFRLTGYSTDSFVVQLFDDTALLKCPDSVSVVNNFIFYFGVQGVAQLSEVGNQPIAKPIYNLLVPFITSNTSLATATFSLGYESDRSYILFTVSKASDTYSTIAYRYNVDSQAWTSWNVSKTCGILKRDNDTLYFGSALDNVLEVERKSFTRFDSADREIVLSLPASSISGTIIKPSSFTTVDVNDVITQTQYVTIYQFNQLLKKLDLDNGLTGQAFYPTFQATQGGNLSSSMTALTAELNIQDTNGFTDTNGNTSYVFSGSTDFATIQTEYNKIIDRLNESPTTFLNNYTYSSGPTLHEAIVIEKDTTLQQFTLEKVPPFLQGPILVYKGVKTEIEFVPQHTGDPSTLKHFSNGTFLFEFRSFYAAEVGFSSDLSMAYDNVTIKPVSYGNWGDFTWGTGAVWGGLGDRAPLRTYIPAKKQRCRYLGARLAHGIALQTYAFYGISLTYETSSERAYR